MLNDVTLIGRVATEIDLRYTPNGAAVANFKLAVDRGFGENKKTAFIPIVVWKAQAENCSNYLSKGKLAAIKGYIDIRSYDGQDRQRRWVTEVIADNVRFLSPKGGVIPEQMGSEVDYGDDDIPF